MSANVKHLNNDNFDSEIKSGVTLVDFYADWCGPCKMIAPIIEQLGSEFGNKAHVAKVDVDKAGQVAEKYQVTSIPTIILFKNGSEIKRVVGVRDKTTLTNMINAAL